MSAGSILIVEDNPQNLKLAQRAYDDKIGVRAGEGAAAVEGVVA